MNFTDEESTRFIGEYLSHQHTTALLEDWEEIQRERFLRGEKPIPPVKKIVQSYLGFAEYNQK